MGARRYTPDLGRFFQRDRYYGALSDLGLTLDPLTGNRYAYAAGRPPATSKTTATNSAASTATANAPSPTTAAAAAAQTPDYIDGWAAPHIDTSSSGGGGSAGSGGGPTRDQVIAAYKAGTLGTPLPPEAVENPGAWCYMNLHTCQGIALLNEVGDTLEPILSWTGGYELDACLSASLIDCVMFGATIYGPGKAGKLGGAVRHGDEAAAAGRTPPPTPTGNAPATPTTRPAA